MSVFDYLFDSHWLMRTDISRLDDRAAQLEQRAFRSGEKTTGLEGDVSRLRRDVSSMLLILETTQRILADRGICSQEDFIHRMRAIDAEDGVEDGRITPGRNSEKDLRFCDACHHYNSVRLQACQYCGRIFGPKPT